MAKLESIDLQYLRHLEDLDLLLKLPRLTKATFMCTGNDAELAKIEAHVRANRRSARKRA